jgi:hypothetical protein
MAVTVEEQIPSIHERPTWRMTSDKFASTYTVRPTRDGFVFYEISISSGKLAPELSGKYSTTGKAIECFERWEQRQTKTPAKKRANNAAASKKQKEETK